MNFWYVGMCIFVDQEGGVLANNNNACHELLVAYY